MRNPLCFLALVCGLLVAMGPAPSRAQVQSDPELTALNTQVIELYRAGKFTEAIPLAQRYAEAMKARHGSEHAEYATALNNLALLLKATNRLSEAEPLMRRALAIGEKSLGPELAPLLT
jgi:tetratricopeptide (TPR) repeat protein